MTGAWVLDTPALNAFTQGSIFVASLLRAFSDRGTGLLVPAICLTEAHATAKDTDLLDLLRTFAAVEVVPLDEESTRGTGVLWRTVPDATASSVHTAYLATQLDAPVVTDHRGRFGPLLPADHEVYHLPP